MDSEFFDPFEESGKKSASSLFDDDEPEKESAPERPKSGGKMRKLDPWSKRHWMSRGFDVVPVTATKTWFDRDSGQMVSISSDFLGVADLMALREGEPAVLIQVSSKKHKSAHLRTIRDGKFTRVWIGSGNRLVLDCWEKNKAGRFVLDQTDVTTELLDILDSRRRH